MQDRGHSRRSRRAARQALVTASLLSTSWKGGVLRVLIIGTDLISSTATLLTSAPRINVMGRFATMSDALGQLKQLNPHVVLVSLRLPDAMGCIQKIEKQQPETAVLTVAGAQAKVDLDAVIGSGAAGLLIDPFSAEELQLAIHAATQGEFVLSQSAAGLLRRRKASSRAAFIRGMKLNEREVRALECLARFLQNKDIAAELGVPVPVAEKILRNVFQKLDVRKRAEAIVLWNTVR